MNRRSVVLAVPGLLLGHGAVRAQPDKLLRIVVGYPAGGGADALARLVAQGLEARFNQKVIVDNKPGANGLIARAYLLSQPADGRTLMLGTTGSVSIAAVAPPEAGVTPTAALAPVAQVAQTAHVVLVGGDGAPGSMDELLRRLDNGAAYGSLGIHTSSHLLGEALAARAGTRPTHVPYAGAAAATRELVGGRVLMVVSTSQSSMQLIRTGRIRALAASGTPGTVPGVPSLGELGYADLDIPSWYGLFAAPATPRPALQEVSGMLRAVLDDEQLRRRLAQDGTLALYRSPEAFAAFLAADQRRWAALMATLPQPR